MKIKITSVILMATVVLVVGSIQAQCESPNEEKAYFNQQLILAAEKGELDRVKTLLKKGSDVNAKTRLGITALMASARGNNIEIVKSCRMW